MTEFLYRYNAYGSPDRAHIVFSVKLESNDRATEIEQLLSALANEDMKGYDISDNEFAKSHGRYMIGGTQVVPNERVFRFGTQQYSTLRCLLMNAAEFPERPNALRNFLLGMQQDWNISLFHYRNHGAGKTLFIVQVTER